MDKKIKIDILKKLIKENSSFSFLLKTEKYKDLYDDIIAYTKQLDLKFIERIYWYVNQLFDYPKCALDSCNKKSTKFLKFKTGYKKYCSASCAAKSAECKQKHIETCRKKYGVDNVAQYLDIQEKIKHTTFQRYGVTNIGAFKPNREKVKQTNLKKYGTLNGHKKDDLIGHKISIARYTNFYHKILNANKDVRPMFTLEQYCQNDKYSEFKWHCNKCENDFFSKVRYGADCIARCLNCNPYSESRPELDIVQFLKSICHTCIKQHDRTVIAPLELDIYIPEKKLAIEFDGLYWHSDDILQNKNYHLNKTELCEKQGIQLIHIFENEWIYKQDIVKSRLKNLFGVYDKTIYARKCKIKEVSSKESKLFQNDNHIQGSVNSGINLGLYFKDELVSLMTFGKCRFNKKYEYELLRFCNRLGYHIPGSASKLLKYFERNYQPKTLISYADRRWSQGKVYEKLGFKLDHIASPNYWYFKGLNLESRVKYQKHKLANILDNFDPNKSEIENMKANGYNRIFDCGNLVYLKI